MPDEHLLERETYLQERRSLFEGESEQSRLFDRAVLTLAAGALGLSITFIHDIVPKYDENTVIWLIYSWFGFISSMILTLVSFQTSQQAIRVQRDILDTKYNPQAVESRTSDNPCSRYTNRLNWASLFTFGLGTIFFAIFVIVNL